MARVLVPASAWLVAAVVLLLPLVAVFAEALRRGLPPALAALQDPDALAAMRLTLLVAAIAVPVNTVGGVAAAWALAKWEFPGRRVLIALVELPFAVSPVVSGLVWVLLFGAAGWFGPWLAARDLQVVFALPGLVLATVFVTFPFVARLLLPLLREQGREGEEAAATLGASGLATLWRVSLPGARWALLTGVLLCNARAMGEFGAVSVVSGHIRGETNTLPLHVEILYNEYQFVGAFAVAALLALLALVTLVAKVALEWAAGRSPGAGRRMSGAATAGMDARERMEGPRAPMRRRDDPVAAATPGVDATGLHRRFAGGVAALDGVDFRVHAGEVVALLGPSGSGKTTLLRALAGLEPLDAGTVRIAGRDVSGTPVRARGVGFVFQGYALFRHMTIAENVGFGLSIRRPGVAVRPSRAERAARVAKLLALVGIPELAGRYPDQASGGQRQRAALARALAIEPPLLLLDEPFGALDAEVRRDLRRWLRGLLRELGTTAVLVTHDQDEALEVADRVAVMRAGRIVQCDTPGALLERPASDFVASFVGRGAALPCGVGADGMARFDPALGLAPMPAPGLPPGPARAVVRPREVRLTDVADGAAVLRATWPDPEGGWRTLLDLPGGVALEAWTEAPPAVPNGARIGVALRAARFVTSEPG